ncbi:P-loop NTPase fold protein [Adhaeribacter radiodurans]|uniref:KAP NTPase domain-containing protein n=1 Tax=Adhaeribacter radiodurans TaxID=2745197 RepID=A0A7L7LDB5_9BACT|nr:P-loop NTPase fold protein [Adhaeribacter radiodurans]QMU30828.1 hypothetical protein HUW48_23590 [Adhaeribacter radiodurans]
MYLDIPINSQSVLFKQHLDNFRNERIIFSGIFGIGKSYFLEKYFDAEREDYVAINLKPINYSISNNEDIFRLIKYDILYELIFTHDLQLVVESVDRSTAYGVLLEDKAPDLLESFLPLIPLLNKEAPDLSPLSVFIKKLLPNFSEIEKIRKDVNLNFRLEEFVKEIDKNFLFESDFITSFIEKSLDTLSNKDNKKSKLKVLIIDDLDRIDPEHTFRLFNIFSAHLDYHKSTVNKFGFDKVIFVCDIDNIRNLFTTRYGANVDFTGYIDKFFSTEIYYFNNDEEIATATNRILESIDFGKYKEFFKEHLFKYDDDDSLLFFLLKECILSGSLNIRRIKSAYGNKFNFSEKELKLRNPKHIYNIHVPVTIAFEILVWLFGSIESLDKALQRLIRFGKSRNVNYSGSEVSEETLAGHFITLLDHQNHKFIIHTNINVESPTLQYKLAFNAHEVIKYNLIKYGDRRNQYYATIISDNEESRIDPNIYLYEIIYQSFQLLREINYLK